MLLDKTTRLHFFIRERKVDLFFLALGIIIGLYFDWDLATIIILLVFLWSILGPISSRILASFGLFFLLLTPLFVTIDRANRAEEFSVYAFYFLAMAVLRAVIETKQGEVEESR